MILSEEFLRHAADCEHMAKFAHDRQSKAVWNGMAERWLRCAEVAKKHSSVTHNGSKTKHHRRADGDGSRNAAI